MVTLAGTQNFNELNCIYERFCLPIFEITLESGSECCNFIWKILQSNLFRNRNIALTKKRISESLANQLQDRIEEWLALVNDTLETPLKKGRKAKAASLVTVHSIYI
jgi:hypothetical protein